MGMGAAGFFLSQTDPVSAFSLLQQKHPLFWAGHRMVATATGQGTATAGIWSGAK